MENDNQNFLRELDSAIESIQKWKQRPELVEEQSSDLISESELKFEYNLVDEEVKIRHADEEKVEYSCPSFIANCRFILWKSCSHLLGSLMTMTVNKSDFLARIC